MEVRQILYGEDNCAVNLFSDFLLDEIELASICISCVFLVGYVNEALIEVIFHIYGTDAGLRLASLRHFLQFLTKDIWVLDFFA